MPQFESETLPGARRACQIVGPGKTEVILNALGGVTLIEPGKNSVTLIKYPRSDAARRYRRWYFSPAWRRLRADQLAREPLCCLCRQTGRRAPATIADHRQPHRGSAALFFDPANLQSLCKTHHDATKRRAEFGRRTIAVARDGWPTEGRGFFEQPKTLPATAPELRVQSREIRGGGQAG